MAGDAGAAPAQGDGAQQGAADGQAQAPAAVIPPEVQQQLETFGQGQAELRQLIQGLGERIPEPAPVAEAEPEPIDLSRFMDPLVDPEAQQLQAQQLQQVIDQRIADGVRRGVEQAVGPLQQQVAAMRETMDTRELVEEFPFLGSDPQSAEQVFETAGMIAQAEGWPAELAQSKQFIRMVTLAGIGTRALEAESQEGDAGADPGAQLEGAGGAGPLGFGPDAARGIVEAGGRRGASALPF